MPRAKHPCAQAGCPVPVPHGTRRCPDHTRERDKARGTRQARGYDQAYDRTRAALTPIVQAGRATCWRCATPIAPDADWHLGHDDHNRSIIRGPEHARCNLSAAGRASHGFEPTTT